MNYHVTAKSANGKTGPIAVSTSSAETCPASCPLSGPAGACYAGSGPLALHWKQVSTGSRGVPLPVFVEQVRSLPAGTMFRHNQAGDLPGAGESIDMPALSALIGATAHLGPSWTYTHKTSWKEIALANSLGHFAINLSADNLEEADELAETGAGPVCVTLAADAPKGLKTPGGRRVAICPAQLSERTNCHNCGNGAPLCARKDRDYVIGFRAHGSRKARIA